MGQINIRLWKNSTKEEAETLINEIKLFLLDKSMLFNGKETTINAQFTEDLS
jgi:hypothetical protein